MEKGNGGSSNRTHPIEGLVQTAMESIKQMVDVNTILGEPIETPEGSVIMPVSRVSFGFAAGGTEYESEGKDKQQTSFPFGGGSGAGISLNPVAFLVVSKEDIRMLPVDTNATFDRLIDLAPKIVEQLQGVAKKDGQGRGDYSRLVGGVRDERPL